MPANKKSAEGTPKPEERSPGTPKPDLKRKVNDGAGTSSKPQTPPSKRYTFCVGQGQYRLTELGFRVGVQLFGALTLRGVSCSLRTIQADPHGSELPNSMCGSDTAPWV
jgi:hypothetical protein